MKAVDYPRITFGIILLNARPFICYNLRALYPFAHQIIVVEGAVPGAAATATAKGHSLDGSLEELLRLQAEEDPENKIEIVTRDGFWSEKDEMSQAYCERATGDYLWQVDIDEFYKAEDMFAVLTMLRTDPEITAVFFKQLSFWGGFDYISDGWYLRQVQEQGPGIVPRIFKWGAGYHYAAHRPVVVRDDRGRDLRHVHPVHGKDLARKGIFMYHYSLLFPHQVLDKSIYYGQAEWAQRPYALQWAEDVYLGLQRPYRVHKIYKYPSWLERYAGTHPDQIEALRTDIQVGRLQIEMRPTADIEHLLASRRYRLARFGLKLLDPFARQLILWWRRWKSRLPVSLRQRLQNLKTIGRW